LDLLEQYFSDLSYEQIEQFSQLNNLLKNINSKINLVSRKDIDFLFERHIIHSLGIAKFIKFKAKTKILDVGTGGGFPGIPLSIVFPDVKFYLIDGIGKKIDSVKSIVNTLGLKNITALKIRAENYTQKVDFVVSRAVSRMEKFVPLVSKNIKLNGFNNIDNGIIYLKGGDLSYELSGFSASKEIKLSNYFKAKFFKTKKIVYIPLSR